MVFAAASVSAEADTADMAAVEAAGVVKAMEMSQGLRATGALGRLG